jgi:hypothetical protein
MTEGNTGFVLFRKDVGNVEGPQNVVDGSPLKTNAILDPDLTNVHTMTKTFRERSPPTPINRSTIVIVERGGMSSIRQTNVFHDIPDHHDRFSPFVHSKNFCFAGAPGGFRFAHTTPCNRPTATDNNVAEEGVNGFFADVHDAVGGRVGGVLRPPIGIRKGHALGCARGMMCPITKVVHKMTRLGKPNAVILSAFQVSQDVFYSLKMALGWIVGELGK